MALGEEDAGIKKKKTLARGFKGETVSPWVGVDSAGGEFNNMWCAEVLNHKSNNR